MMSASVTSSSVARKAATRWIGRSEMKPTVSERIACFPEGRPRRRIVGSRVANSMSAAPLAVQGPGALDGVELALQTRDALADQPAVELDLALARPAQKPEPAAL